MVTSDLLRSVAMVLGEMTTRYPFQTGLSLHIALKLLGLFKVCGDMCPGFSKVLF